MKVAYEDRKGVMRDGIFIKESQQSQLNSISLGMSLIKHNEINTLVAGVGFEPTTFRF
jgi:hypothetical protein